MVTPLRELVYLPKGSLDPAEILEQAVEVSKNAND